jgi:hypothetical protein
VGDPTVEPDVDGQAAHPIVVGEQVAGGLGEVPVQCGQPP